jgi:protein phosphatase
MARAAAPERPRRTKRLLIWVGVVVVLIVGALIGVRLYLNSQWYVGVADGKVAIYNGIPTKVLVFNLSHVDSTTNISAAAAERLNQWRDLAQGHTVGSHNAALTLVAQIRQDVSQGGTGGSP